MFDSCAGAAGCGRTLAFSVHSANAPSIPSIASDALALPLLLRRPSADCTAALLRTDLLERSRFDPFLVGWLLDRGADPAAPLPHSCAGQPCTRALACRAAGRGPCVSRCRCPPTPAVGLLLQKLQGELHVSRRLSKLHAAAGSGQEAWLLRRAADCLQRLLAAGAAPAGAPDPSGSVAAAVSAMQPGDWAAVRGAAMQPPEWTPERHQLFPKPFREAGKQVLLVARRGFCLPTSPEAGSVRTHNSRGSRLRSSVRWGSSNAAPENAPGDASCSTDASASKAELLLHAPQHGPAWWLDGGIVLCIIKQLAPSAAHARADLSVQPWEPS